MSTRLLDDGMLPFVPHNSIARERCLSQGMQAERWQPPRTIPPWTLTPKQLIEPPDDRAASDRRVALLNTFVAITVALLATFMGVCKVKDDNIVQAMQQAQAEKLELSDNRSLQ